MRDVVLAAIIVTALLIWESCRSGLITFSGGLPQDFLEWRSTDEHAVSKPSAERADS